MRHDFIRPSLAGSAVPRRRLFPDIAPYRTGWLKVSNTHDIYFEECGSPSGKPALMVHGGPGGKYILQCAVYHDPAQYRIILFDQRGCGREHAARRPGREHHLGSRRRHGAAARAPRHRAWQVFGGSGAHALAGLRRDAPGPRLRARAARHLPPAQERDRLVLSARAQLDLPGRLGAIPRARSREPSAAIWLNAYHRRLTCGNREVAAEAARAWSIWEGTTLLALLQTRSCVHAFGERQLRARLRAHRVPLLRQQGLPPKRQSAHRGCQPDRAYPRHDCPRPLRRCNAAQECLGFGQGLAESGPSHCPRFRTRNDGARHRP